MGRLRRGVARPIDSGDHVKIAAHVGGNLDDGSSFSVRGETGRAIGSPYKSTETGEQMQPVQLDDGGAVVSVPARCLKHD